MRKSIICEQSVVVNPRLLSSFTSLWGIIVLKVKLKPTNSILTYGLGCSRSDRGCVKCSQDCILHQSVSMVGKLAAVQIRGDVDLDMRLNKLYQTFHND